MLLADGSTESIEDVRVGSDRIWATDPETGEEGPRTVLATITSSDVKDLVEITVAITGSNSGTTTVVATSEHPIWVENQGRWTHAEDLTRGDNLVTATGDAAQIVRVERRTEIRRVHNLTINGTHTYYVAAGATPVLVHNVNEGDICNLTLGPNLTGQKAEGATAERGDTVLAHQQRMINEFGDRNGCAACGAEKSGYKDGHWTGDHNPPNKLSPNGPWTLYPHCRKCSKQQGGIVRTLIKEYYGFPALRARQ
ncbi:polymorphic toxin-type HINT domain-containing protein [Saccharomonospora piscinae]|uniref:polymorphic toxin-type HINT domain-containing protein n=1 Tax=Saccharomonospora piscinae TaxID=687388 RepID=UPI00142418B6|nr:polymorphic toxin-type HINT domain-containing protein [Saccharomonospora piscinae]